MQAASLGIPFQPIRGLYGTDVAAASGFTTVRDPYSGEDVYVVPRIRPDWAVLHVHEADEQGNARLHGSPGYDLVMMEAAAHVILTAERIIPPEEFAAHPEWTKIPGIFVQAVVLAPRGAFPCGCMPDYDVDPAGIDAYLRAAGAEDRLREYLGHVNP
jgi:glutaconate CoA-transferase, subunit A